MTVDLIPCVVSILAGIVSIVFGILALRKTRKRESIHQPCYFCGVSEYEHRQECPVAHYRKPFKLPSTNAALKRPSMIDVLFTKEAEIKLDFQNARTGTSGPQYVSINGILDNDLRVGPGVETARVDWNYGKPQFKPGQWVRMVCDFMGSGRPFMPGELGKILNPRGCKCGPKGEECFDIQLCGRGVQAIGGTFEPALPRKGEWWGWTHEECPFTGYGHLGSKFEWSGYGDMSVDEQKKYVWLGCLVPVNFGKGNS